MDKRLEYVKHLIDYPYKLSQQELLTLQLAARELEREINSDRWASQGVGGLLGGCAASVLFGPFAILPILAGIVGGSAFGKQAHQEAYEERQRLLRQIRARLDREGVR